MSDQETTHRGTCFCGAVEVTARGAPFTMGYCHCHDCRAWSAGPVNAFTLWEPEKVEVTRGEELLGSYDKSGSSDRRFCTRCGGHVLTNHVPGNFVDVYAAILPSLPFKPDLHVNYASAVLPIKDGLPKLKDFPAEIGGTGETMEE
ncbi:MAG TPA: GFA family protein [Kiloniellales bacterium]|jgi:hypothetical protein|nr:GFA family protein [Kiloniellales bacterium]